MILSTIQSRIVPALKALGVDSRAAVERREVDPIVYLIEQAGGALGYRFEWERYGPFSEALAEDLAYLTAEDLERSVELDAHVREATAQVREIIDPVWPGLNEFTWIRLLASVHFLRRYSGLTLTNGDRPPLLLAPPYEKSMIDNANGRIAPLLPS